MRVLKFLVAVVLAVQGLASAAELGGVTLPDTVDVQGKTLQLNGLGMREASVFKVDVYVGGLYLENSSSDAQAILTSSEKKVLVLRFVRDVEVAKIRQGWNDGFEKNSSNIDTLRARIDVFNGYMVDMGAGGDMTFTFTGEGVSVSIGGSEKGVIDGADFASALLAIWLGPKPPNEGLKKGLLGG